MRLGADIAIGWGLQEIITENRLKEAGGHNKGMNLGT